VPVAVNNGGGSGVAGVAGVTQSHNDSSATTTTAACQLYQHKRQCFTLCTYLSAASVNASSNTREVSFKFKSFSLKVLKRAQTPRPGERNARGSYLHRVFN
jgi:hypothetical protein